MKYILLACFFFGVTTQVVFAQMCALQSECAETKCCTGVPPFGGICVNFTTEGGKCHLVDKTVPMFGDFYIGPCPCVEGLTCVPTGGKKKNDGTCQLPPTEAPAVDADDTPVEEPAADDTPVEEPAADDTPVEEPAADDTPVEEPAADDTPVEEPAADDTPAEEPAAEAGDSAASDSAAAAE